MCDQTPVRGLQLWLSLEQEVSNVRESASSGVTLLRGARDRLIQLGLDALSVRVRVVWNPRMRSTAGRATWPQALIELNPALLGTGEVERTLLHELAHLVAFERAGRRRILPHGVEWRQACAELGIPGEAASHRLALPTRRLRRKWAYVCPHCLVKVERVRRMRRHMACWSCCREHNGGEYDERFRFREVRLPEQLE